MASASTRRSTRRLVGKPFIKGVSVMKYLRGILAWLQLVEGESVAVITKEFHSVADRLEAVASKSRTKAA